MIARRKRAILLKNELYEKHQAKPYADG